MPTGYLRVILNFKIKIFLKPFEGFIKKFGIFFFCDSHASLRVASYVTWRATCPVPPQPSSVLFYTGLVAHRSRWATYNIIIPGLGSRFLPTGPASSFLTLGRNPQATSDLRISSIGPSVPMGRRFFSNSKSDKCAVSGLGMYLRNLKI
jgi:hypothetical protein